MSKGSKIVPVRIPYTLLAKLLNEIADKKKGSGRKVHSTSSWIRQAIREKIEHLRRGRKKTTAADPFE